MARTIVTEGLSRAANLIPFRAAGASRLTGEYGAVCTPAITVPEQFRAAQEERTAYYMSHDWTEGHRSKPDHAPRYWVTSYGVPIAWVTLDGRTHFADLTDPRDYDMNTQPATWRAMRSHQRAIHATWPARFVMNSEGDPVGR